MVVLGARVAMMWWPWRTGFMARHRCSSAPCPPAAAAAAAAPPPTPPPRPPPPTQVHQLFVHLQERQQGGVWLLLAQRIHQVVQQAVVEGFEG